MSRSQREQFSHDEMVRAMAKHFTAQGYAVSADVPGYTSPPLVNGRRPDVAVYTMGRLAICWQNS